MELEIRDFDSYMLCLNDVDELSIDQEAERKIGWLL